MASPSAILKSTIITGTVPAARQLLADYDFARRTEGCAVWDSPDILPRDAWMRRSWEECAWSDPAATPVLLTRWQELALWEEAIRSAPHDILLNAHATARAAAQAWQMIHAWEAPLDGAAFEHTEDCASFAQWMSRVRGCLADRGWITLAELPGALHRRLAFGTWKHDANVVAPPELFGFDEIAPADRRLFEASGAVELPAPAQASERWRAVCHDAADELTRAAVWARGELEKYPDTRIGVAIPGLASAAGIAERIFDDVLHPGYGFERGARAFEIIPGATLAESPMIAAALLILRLIDGVPREEAAPLWRSPFLGGDPEEGAKLDLELRRARVDRVGWRTGLVARRFPELAEAIANSRERVRPSKRSEEFSSLLSRAGWPGPRPLAPREVQAAEAWKDLLSDFARLDNVLDSISRDRAFLQLEQMAEATCLPPERGTAPVQILDVAEVTGLSFDALWIAGWHAGAWPRRVQPNPFVPLVLQRAAGMPGSSADHEFAYAQRVSARLFASAAEVVCSYPAHAAAAEKSEEQQASPLINAFPVLPEVISASDTAVRRVFMSAPELESRPAYENLGLPMGTESRGGARVLADQSACPFRAFAVHRLQAREMDEPDVGLSPRDRGSLAHRVLEFLWVELRTSERLAALSTDELDVVIGSCTRAALEKYFARQDASPALAAFRAVEQDRLETLMRKWLAIEKTRRPFEVVYNEFQRVIEVEGLRLKLRVDRIDRYSDGTHAIVDYKTSKKDLKPDMWRGERPEEPQLPLYAVTTDEPVSEVAFAQLTTASQEWIREEGASLKEMLPEWKAVVHRLATDFLNGHAEVDPREKPSPCDLCRLHALCRIHELKRLPREGSDLVELAAEDNGE